MPQSKRTETLERFKDGEIRLLVASDVAARGLDIQGMSHVFNFDVPIHAEDYVHRIGRTGRAGREGRAFTIATPEDGRFVQAITRLIGKDIPVISIEGVGPAEVSDEDGDTRRHGHHDRRRGRGHGRRDHRREGRPQRPAAEERTMRPAPPSDEPQHVGGGRATPRAAQPQPGREQRQRHQRRGQPREVLPPITMDPDGKVTPLPARRGGEPQRERDDDGRIVGFGDHLPAFLARSSKVARG
jgi:superfamily II DNA/RNA helicase